MVFENKRSDAHSIFLKALEDADLWFEANNREHERDLSATLHHSLTPIWCPPAMGTLKCNISSLWIGKHVNCEAAWIVRNHTGVVLNHGHRLFSHIEADIDAGSLSLLWAAKSLKSLRYQRVIFETSIPSLVEAMHYPLRFHSCGALISSIQNSFSSFNQVSLVLCTAEAN